MDENDLPFKVGQLAEARSFAQGYRGAWFRCKIIDIARRDSGMLYALQYYDFPDEKLNWTKLYQYPKPRLKNTERQLMVRPCFPSVYRENKLSEIKTISEVVVVVNDVWKVGDFVDWWTDGCYWSGRLTKALGNEKYLIDLFPPPAGEGSSYEASSKDFRPSLSWSLDNGWIVPIPSVIDNHHPCARLIKPLNQGRKDPEATGRASSKLNASISSHIETSRSELMGKGQLNPAASNETRTPGRNTGLDETNGGATKSSCSDSQSSPHVRGASAEVAEDTGGKDNDSNDPPLKKMKTDGGMYLDSTCSDTIESAILDLEVLVNRIKWMKDALKFGLPLSNTATQSWKFLEHRGPSRPK
ncbi:Arginine--tRNA ligase [Salix suchowensis]|nr:Arginine--tRNA ligase [Salix suchowensis]